MTVVTKTNVLILGGGISGLSTAWHIGHDQCLILEKGSAPGGVLRSHVQDGFTWDNGPHVSFTKNETVRDLFVRSVAGAYNEYPVVVENSYYGAWVDHPAQSNLYQLPQPLRTQARDSLLFASRQSRASDWQALNYGNWLNEAYGRVFTDALPRHYTRKYWTCDPELLTTEWVGPRMYHPSEEEINACYHGPLSHKTHYMSTVRYPQRGGYQSFADLFCDGARVECNADVVDIDLDDRAVWSRDGRKYDWKHLVNTMPLPVFIACCRGVPDAVRKAASRLVCTQALLVNVVAPHIARRPSHWLYVYDEGNLATRINFTEKLSKCNGIEGMTGIQVEVYASPLRPFASTPEVMAERVVQELRDMALIDANVEVSWHTRVLPWANVVFTVDTARHLEIIWEWLKTKGLRREIDDVHPLTDWSKKPASEGKLPMVSMAGRFGQWKYFWSDDCVLRGRWLAGTQ